MRPLLVIAALVKPLISRPPDSKFSKLAAKALPLQIDFIDTSSRRSLPAPGDEFFEPIRSPFGDDLDCTIAAVHDPAGQAQAARLLNCRSAIIDALHSSHNG